jgi:hypothetical protein
MLVMDEVLPNNKVDSELENTAFLAMLEERHRNIEAGRVIVFENDDWMSYTPEQLKAVAEEQRSRWT